MTSPATANLERNMLGISIPLLKGIQGLRILLVNKSQQNSFANLRSAEQIKTKIYGQGVSWVDTQILKAEGYTVATTTAYKNLFELLVLERIDAFPRGINEAFKEFELWNKRFPAIEVEQNLMLYYPLFVQFYVKKDNVELHTRVSKGLMQALQNKQFEQLFNEYFAEDIKRANLNERKMFVLNNAFTPQPLVEKYKNLLHSAIRDGLNKEKQNLDF